MNKDIYQHQKKFYEEYWKRRENENYIHTNDDKRIPPRIKVAVDMILKDFVFNENKPISVIDIGCGEGTFGKLLREQLKDKVYIIGCDISDTALNRASFHYSNLFQ